MTVQTPFVAGPFVVSEVETVTTSLTFALLLSDDYTGERPVGNTDVILEEVDVRAKRNLSGYFLFTDLVPGIYGVRVESEYYSPVREIVDTSALDRKNPVVRIALTPNPRYPFSSTATLLRGMVAGPTGPVEGAQVSVTGRTSTALTDSRGEFVLPLRGIKKGTVTVRIEKGSDVKTEGAVVEEGKTVSTGTIDFP